jgi:hypothetical protein
MLIQYSVFILNAKILVGFFGGMGACYGGLLKPTP